MDPSLPSDKDSFLAPADLSASSNPTNVLELDQQPRLARRKRSAMSPYSLCTMFARLVASMIVIGFALVIFVFARGQVLSMHEPHDYALATDDTSSVVKSYYGEHIPRFNVVANVYIRFGKELPISESGGSNSKSRVLREEEIFGEWESIFSQTIYSHIDLNSTTKAFYKTVNLPISQNVLARMYQPHTYFPQIINTFVVVPSDPDPVLSLLRPPTLTAFNLTDTIRPDPKFTSWTQYPLDKLVRPMDPQMNTIDDDDTSRWRNASATLEAFYDAAAVKESALWPVQDRWTSWSRLESPGNETNLATTGILPVRDELDESDERAGLFVRRNASVKIKTSTWISMIRQTPIYDLKEYLTLRENLFHLKKLGEQYHLNADRLNRPGPRIIQDPYHFVGHTPSHLVQNISSTDAVTEEGWSETQNEHNSMFYGPHLFLHGHAAGLHDWITLPRVNASSEAQSDPFIVPWRIAFQLPSNFRAFSAQMADWHFTDTDEHPMNLAYKEAELLENREFWNSLVGHDDGSSRRPVLRAIFHAVGSLIEFPTIPLIHVHFLYTRALSTGISIPSNLLNLVVLAIETAFVFHFESFDSIVVKAIILAFILGAAFLEACLLWGFEFQWGGWNKMLPVGVTRHRLTHSERRSRRVDFQFTWLQRGLLVVVLTICLAHFHKTPHLIPSVLEYTQVPAATPSPYSSSIGKFLYGVSQTKYGRALMPAVESMSTISQILLNKRLGSFGGSYPCLAWAELMMSILKWTPTVLHSIFGKFHTSEPLGTWDVVEFFVNGSLLWQAMKYPVVKQDEEEEE